MQKLKKIALSITVIGLIVTQSIALADYKSDIINSCTTYQQGRDKSDINPCKLYIDGFIDALLYAEKGAIKAKSLNKIPQSDYLKRVYRTRIASKLDNEDAYQFCIDREYDRKSVASILAKSIDIQLLQSKPLKEVLFTALTRNFPCR
ncbi:MAG: Rap1a/Tai family immunity protein [Oceanospirillaceae bacterium]